MSTQNQSPLQQKMEIISQPLPANILAKDFRGNSYVPSAVVIGMLNTQFPFAWKSEVAQPQLDDKRVYMDDQKDYKTGAITKVEKVALTYSALVKISLNINGEWIHYQDMGVHVSVAKTNQIDQAVSTGKKGCISKGITRCCRQFGFGLHLYDKQGKVQSLRDTMPTVSEVVEPQQQSVQQPIESTPIMGSKATIYAWIDAEGNTSYTKKLEWLAKKLPKSEVSLVRMDIDASEIDIISNFIPTLTKNIGGVKSDIDTLAETLRFAHSLTLVKDDELATLSITRTDTKWSIEEGDRDVAQMLINKIRGV